MIEGKRISSDGKAYWEPEEVEKLIESVKKNGRDYQKAVRALDGAKNRRQIENKMFTLTRKYRKNPSLPYAALFL